ncbi:SixA phosphatase family protein [Knoellia sp. Soil729]|uniref:SixA phosphatase family protein n=1 Tax=Knoellia sp. Soil729 TaxID=1736394 RepID=UPI0006FFD5B3|nr:histidine phosphatase family protein [Knoellia sp. Soil729]KRE43624.1 phosphohistidine phosphatase [Knoellia sp. Soil729]
MTTAAEDRTLVLVRHAKAEQGGYDADHERELAPRGHRDAEGAGRWLCEQGIGVDEVFCSTAIRALQTCEGIWKAGCCEADIHEEHRIYNASADRLLEVVREADADANVVMLVGHAPGIPVLASLLADGEGSDRAHDLMSQGFPTTGVALLRFSGHWSELAPGVAQLDRFHVARATDHESA